MAIAIFRGHEIKFVNDQWVFEDGTPIESENRKCTKCNKEPLQNGIDACLGNLTGVKNACCGHGGRGYIQFNNDTVIRFDNLTVDNPPNMDFEKVYHNDLSQCSCGNPKAVQKMLFKLLSHRQDDNNESREEILKSIELDTFYEFIMHVFDHNGLLEHGGSIYGSFLTDEGKEFVELLKKELEE